MANKKNHMDKQLVWIIVSMAIALICLLAIPFIVKYKNSANYEGLKFQKVSYGQLEVYYYSYGFKYMNQSYAYNLYVRNDPTKNNIPVNGTIRYQTLESKAYISFDFENLASCNNSIREVTTLTLFLEGNLLKTNLSSPDLDYSRAHNTTYANCMTPKDNMVIMIQKGNESRIDKYNRCYVLSVKNCEDMLNVVEKFEVQSIADAKKR